MVKTDYTVYLSVIDGYVYDFGQNVVDIIYGLQNYDRVILDMVGEGPDFSELGITDTIEKIIKTYNVEFGRLVLHTVNLCESYDKIEVQRFNTLDMDSNTSSIPAVLGEPFKYSNVSSSHNRDISKHFGCFVGRSNYSRLAIASHLHKHHRNLTDMTYHLDPTSDYHKSHIGIEKLMHFFGSDSDIVKNSFDFLPATPITLADQTITEFPIVNLPDISNNLTERYKHIFLDVVCETYITGNTKFYTEKTVRCFATKTPFILVGPKNILSRLHDNGFKTFDRWWNESYDEDGEQHRIKSVINLLDELSKLTLDEMQCMYKEMQGVLDHNYNRFTDILFNGKRYS